MIFEETNVSKLKQTGAKPVYVELEAKNNMLIRAMSRKHITSIAELARQSGVGAKTIRGYLHLTVSPLTQSEWKSSALALSVFFTCAPEDLFCHEEQLLKFEVSRFGAELSFLEWQRLFVEEDQVTSFLPEILASANDLRAVIDRIIGDLTLREQGIIRMLFGLHSEKMRARDIAKVFDIKDESRVRQIASSALRKLCDPEKLRMLECAGALDGDIRVGLKYTEAKGA